MTIIQPTRTCFDDAVELLVEICTHVPEMKENVRVVHALIEGNEPGKEGDIIAHGWLETEDEVFFCGMVDGKKIQLCAPRREYYKETKVRMLIRYTGREVADLNSRTEHTGPWDDIFRPYTGNYKQKDLPDKV